MPPRLGPMASKRRYPRMWITRPWDPRYRMSKRRLSRANRQRATIEVVDAPLPTDTTPHAASDVSEGMESVGDETAVALGSESTKSQEMPGAERAGTRKPHAAKKGE